MRRPFKSYKERINPTSDIILLIVTVGIGALLWWKYGDDIPLPLAVIFGGVVVLYYFIIWYVNKFVPGQYYVTHLFTMGHDFHVVSRFRDEPAVDKSYKYTDISAKFVQGSRAVDTRIKLEIFNLLTSESKNIRIVIDSGWDYREAETFCEELKKWKNDISGEVLGS